MKTNFFSITGVLSRTEYFKVIAVLLTELIVITAVTSFIMEMQNAEVPGAPVVNQVVAITMFALMILNIVLVCVAMLSAVMRRARDTGHTVVWTSLSILVPFVFISLGFAPTNNKKS